MSGLLCVPIALPICLTVVLAVCMTGCQSVPEAPQWAETELTFRSQREYRNAYTDVAVHVDFAGPDGGIIRRPAFWDGERTWRVRFAPPTDHGTWTWKSSCSEPADGGLHGQTGQLVAVPYTGSNPLLKHGLLRMSAGRRNVIHADGSSFLMVADTPWSLPWRGTIESVSVYAGDRKSKGFNAALLMSVQPDRGAKGPRDRVSVGGFEVGFEDLSAGHLNELNVPYFQYMDKLMLILIDAGIVPVYNPVFQGYGWKGLNALGQSAVPEEYARYCRYLVARYGARPAMWLVSADNTGLQACVEAGGKEIHEWDAYQQPTGIHYSPFDDPSSRADYPKGLLPHYNRSHQDKPWLDFQWCQTGHHGEHNTQKVSQMHVNQPTKAVANGEPTYEGLGDDKRAVGWWQGNEAWSNLTAGGTMGVVYGAGALWQWKLTRDEPGWPAWAVDAGCSWREALDKEGSRYVGYISRAFAGVDFADMTRLPELAAGRSCVGIRGKLYVVYLPSGGPVNVWGFKQPMDYRWFDPRGGTWTAGGKSAGSMLAAKAPSDDRWVLFVTCARPAESSR